MSGYMEKLKDPRWQKKRLEVFARDGWKCQRCGIETETLNVHHIHYSGKNPWDTELKYLTTMCAGCHEYETEQMKYAIRYLKRSLTELCLTSDDIIEIANGFEDYVSNLDFQKRDTPSSSFPILLADMIRDYDDAVSDYHTCRDKRNRVQEEEEIMVFAPGRILQTVPIPGLESFGVLTYQGQHGFGR